MAARVGRRYLGTAGRQRGIVTFNITKLRVYDALRVAVRPRWVLACGGIDLRVGGPSVQLRTHVHWVHNIANGAVSRQCATLYEIVLTTSSNTMLGWVLPCCFALHF